MKENVATKDNIADPAEEQPALDSKPEKPAVSSPTKKAPVVRKPIRPRIARPAAPATATKPDAFEVEFAFDPNEDPFKPKKKLGASPTREGSPQNQSEANICNTHQVVRDFILQCHFTVHFLTFDSLSRITLKPITL